MDIAEAGNRCVFGTSVVHNLCQALLAMTFIRTATSVKVKANNITTDPTEFPTVSGLIMVLDSLGNYGDISITINNLA